ncbi:hypothetical protein PG5_33960 [Pseudomonas sp. G5(2012)]|nr:hypothetical protein PG5_33960 [Pseudomonas sp. G5(2012)]
MSRLDSPLERPGTHPGPLPSSAESHRNGSQCKIPHKDCSSLFRILTAIPWLSVLANGVARGNTAHKTHKRSNNL